MTTNEAMVALWNSDETAAWASHPDRYDIMLEPFGVAVLDATPLDDGDRVLDVGCGAGALTLAAASSVGPAGHAIGADISTSLLALARRRAEARRAVNVTVVEADMQVHGVDAAADVIVSRFGVMFFADPAAAFTNLRAGTRRGGRLAFACWQPVAQNEWAMVPVLAVMSHVGVPTPPAPDAPGPFSFGHRDRIKNILDAAGWSDIVIDEFTTTIHVGRGGDSRGSARLLSGGRLRKAAVRKRRLREAGSRRRCPSHRTP